MGLLRLWVFVTYQIVSGSLFSPVCLISVDRLEQKCIVLKTGDQMYICDFPNAYERD